MATIYLSYTSKSLFKYVNRLSIISCRILFHSSTMASFKELRLVILWPRYTRVLRSQNLLDSNLSQSVAGDGAPVIEVVYCLSAFQG